MADQIFRPDIIAVLSIMKTLVTEERTYDFFQWIWRTIVRDDYGKILERLRLKREERFFQEGTLVSR